MEGVFFFLLVGCVAAEYTSLEYSFCDSSNVIQVSNLAVTPMPILQPGYVHFSGDFTTTRAVRNASLSLSVRKQGYFFDLPIPCLLRVGSCTYGSICTMVDEMMTENWAGVMGKLGRKIRQMFESRGFAYNKCPIPANQILSIRNERLRIPRIPAVLSWLTNGDYGIKIEVDDTVTREKLLCLDLNLSFKKDCTGFSCYFGK